MKKRVLVTGAGGFLGRYICRYFLRQGWTVAGAGRGKSLDLGGREREMAAYWSTTLPDPRFAGLVADFRPDVLVHCAGAASVVGSVASPYEDFGASAGICAFTLETLRQQAPACQFILLSSASIYGNPSSLPVAETAPRRPLSPYGYHKAICELLVEEYAAVYGLPAAVLRIFSAYGEGLRRQVVFDLCRKFSQPGSRSVTLYGTGRETRDFIHGEDVAAAVGCIVAAGAGGVYNIASGCQTAIGDLAAMVREYLGSDKAIGYTGAVRRGEPLCWQADTARARSMGFTPAVGLADGVRRYCDWFRRQEQL
ncbi:MAG TPA: NAD-dependent epimerase/dehydratase family protein [Methylomusa anaerophila]|uniref:GDP-6-deoxy-D-mannose reductase n=1 Tax=Methylomusa anaerophila TaxID=1930071 RepID=A0A348AKP5_9FIRM|nr:NAD-dependent epimerase/dehydratase family protein [Methylomusa anaerophila]BBB91643.1 GDP-6-deoxy-D-mannose reductase [Methylomusa anaerophila]HML88623.1 NAD-dependent epimerase/dehydratase family protein [Methylomusa anaerophila]